VCVCCVCDYEEINLQESNIFYWYYYYYYYYYVHVSKENINMYVIYRIFDSWKFSEVSLYVHINYAIFVLFIFYIFIFLNNYVTLFYFILLRNFFRILHLSSIFVIFLTWHCDSWTLMYFMQYSTLAFSEICERCLITQDVTTAALTLR